jgi:hypothetical protein
MLLVTGHAVGLTLGNLNIIPSNLGWWTYTDGQSCPGSLFHCRMVLLPDWNCQHICDLLYLKFQSFCQILPLMACCIPPPPQGYLIDRICRASFTMAVHHSSSAMALSERGCQMLGTDVICDHVICEWLGNLNCKSESEGLVQYTQACSWVPCITLEFWDFCLYGYFKFKILVFSVIQFEILFSINHLNCFKQCEIFLGVASSAPPRNPSTGMQYTCIIVRLDH